MKKDITHTGTAIDRYLTAFENNTLDPTLLQDRLTALRAKTTQLRTRRDELTDLLAQAPAMPTDDELDALANHIDDSSSVAARPNAKPSSSNSSKIHIVGPNRIRPIYRIPRPSQDSKPAANDGTTIRTMGNPVGDTGIEPVTSSV